MYRFLSFFVSKGSGEFGCFELGEEGLYGEEGGVWGFTIY